MAADHAYFSKEKAVLKVVGLSFSKTESLSYRVYCYLSLVLVVFGYPILQLTDMFKYDFNSIVHTLVYEFGITLGAAKAAVVVRNREKFADVMAKLERTLGAIKSNPKDPIELELVDRCVSITTAQTFAYWILSVASAFITLSYCIVKRAISSDPNDWEFPFGKLTILNVTYSPNYEITFAYQVFSCFFIACHFLTIDLITAAVLCHISYHFKIVQNRLAHLVEYARRREFGDKIANGDYNKRWKPLKRSLEELVNYHLSVIGIAHEMEEVFSDLLLVVFLGTLGMLCLMVYQASMLKAGDLRLFRYISEVMVGSIQVFLVCYWGEQISQNSQEVARAAYEMDFVGCDLKLQKALTMIMVRSQRPVSLSAGKFTTVGLSTFGWILRSSYSAFIMLRNVNVRQEGNIE